MAVPFDDADFRTFFSEIRSYFANPNRLQGEAVEIVATGIASDGAAIVVFRDQAHGPLWGLHVDLTEFSALFDPRDATSLAQVISDEIAEPGGAGEKLDVEWAQGLVDHPESVRWRLI